MKIHILSIQGALLFGLWLITTNTFAKDIFQITLTTSEMAVSREYSSAEEAINDLGDEGFFDLNPQYTSGSAAVAVLDFRGLRTLACYGADSTELIFKIPSLGIDKKFDGGTRDGSQEELEDYLKKNGDNILTRMLQALAAKTPIDPVAGNPASLSGRMISDSFAAGAASFRQTDVAVQPPPLDSGLGYRIESTSGRAETPNAMTIGLTTGHFNAGDYEQNTLTLPLSYTIYFDNPGYQLRFDLPLNYTHVGSSAVYGTALGANLRVPLTDTWSLTPGIRTGATGSIDMAAAGVVYAGTLTSNYRIPFDLFDINIANMVGAVRTQSISWGDYEVDYDLKNTVFKNGISFEGETSPMLLSLPTSLQFSLAHTLITGDEVFIDNYWDFSFSWGARRQADKGAWDNLRVGVTLTIGNHDYAGGRLNVGYTF